MKKICRGIQHTILLKNIDRYNDTQDPPTQREYTCVLQNVETDNSVTEEVSDWKEYDDGDKKTVYAKVAFPVAKTEALKDGKVSLAVFDKNTRDIIYYNKHYAKVFTTKLD